MANPSAFPCITSSLDLRAKQYQANREAWAPVLERFEDALRATTVEGNPKSLSNHQARGQLLGGCTSERGAIIV
jgi:hypothetical protein